MAYPFNAIPTLGKGDRRTARNQRPNEVHFKQIKKMNNFWGGVGAGDHYHLLFFFFAFCIDIFIYFLPFVYLN